jgi:hypothetical protein
MAAARAFVKEHFGPHGWRQLLARFDERSAVFWDGLIIPDLWYPAALFDDFLDQLLRSFDGEMLGEHNGRRIASAEIRNRIFLPTPLINPARAIEDGARLWQSYVNAGRMRVVDRQPDGLTLVLDNPGVHPLLCGDIVIGWGSETIRRTSATVRSNTHRCGWLTGDDHCSYQISWSQH